MTDRSYAKSFFRRRIFSAHFLIAGVLFFTYIDPRDAWIIFGGSGLAVAAGLYSGFRYMSEYDEPTKVGLTELFKKSVIAYIVAPVTVIFVLSEEDIIISSDVISQVVIVAILIFETMSITTILSYTILYKNGIHSFSRENPEFTKDAKGLYKLLGIILIFPFFVFTLLNMVILGTRWFMSELEIVTVTFSILIILVIGYVLYLTYIKYVKILKLANGV